MKDTKKKSVVKVKTKKSTRWQLTENNPECSKDEVATRLAALGKAIYIAVCNEVGEHGTSHYHAFVVFENAISGNSISEAFPRAHLEACRGSSESNRAYLAKQDSELLEVGECPLTESVPRVRDEASEVLSLIFAENNEKNPLEVAREHPEYAHYIVLHYRSLTEMYGDYNEQKLQCERLGALASRRRR